MQTSNLKDQSQNFKFKTFKFLIIFLFVPLFFIFLSFTANAQEVHENEITAGKVLSEKLQKKEVQCSSLKDSDFEKLGEFYMEKMIGDSQRHELMDKHIERMHGKDGLGQMHISMGKYYSGCPSTGSINSLQASSGFSMAPFGMGMQEGGGWNMMGPGFGFGNMMNFGMGGWGFFGIFGFIYWILILVILVLIAAWLWKQVQKK